MSAVTLEKILQEVETLTPDEKISLVERLWVTIPVDLGIEKAWFEEAKRRTHDAEAGKSGYVSWDEVKSKYENHIEKLKATR
ncbi:MAG: hypothetical protein LDLANPLL_00836 [Turneriella sp.]|nr:hypothetical protein [Turneriella sp.]